MKLHTRITTMAIAVAIAVLPITSKADWIGDFYNAAGAGINVTPPQAISSQSVVGFAGGGVSWRVPNKSFQLMSITPPSLSSGCGGIDGYLGAYSFPNKAAFVAALRNFGQASLGYFFNLALKTMAPEIESTLAGINDLATKINSFQIGGCKDAKKMVDSLADMLYDATAKSTAGGLRADGTEPDQNAGEQAVQAKSYWDTVRERYAQISGKTRAALTPSDAGLYDFPEMNVLWFSLKHNPATDLSDDEIELIMSMVGPTLIIRGANDKDGNQNQTADGGQIVTIGFKDLVGLSPTSSAETLKILRCNDYELCLNPTPSTQGFVSFAKNTIEAVQKVKTGVASRTYPGLNTQEQMVMKLSSVPLYRAAAMAATSGVIGGVSDGMLGDLADYAAMDAGRQFVLYYLDIAEKGLSKTAGIKQAYAPGIAAMVNRIRDIRTSMYEETRNYQALHGNPFEKLDQLEKVERYMYSNLNVMLAANARFSKH